MARTERKGVGGGGCFWLAPGKTTIKKLYGENGRPPNLSFSLSLCAQTQQLDAADSVSAAGNYTSWRAALEIRTGRSELLQDVNGTHMHASAPLRPPLVAHAL